MTQFSEHELIALKAVFGDYQLSDLECYEQLYYGHHGAACEPRLVPTELFFKQLAGATWSDDIVVEKGKSYSLPQNNLLSMYFDKLRRYDDEDEKTVSMVNANGVEEHVSLEEFCDRSAMIVENYDELERLARKHTFGKYKPTDLECYTRKKNGDFIEVAYDEFFCEPFRPQRRFRRCDGDYVVERGMARRRDSNLLDRYFEELDRLAAPSINAYEESLRT